MFQIWQESRLLSDRFFWDIVLDSTPVPSRMQDALCIITPFIPKWADLKDAVALAYGISIGSQSNLSGIHENEAFHEVSDKSKQDVPLAAVPLTQRILH